MHTEAVGKKTGALPAPSSQDFGGLVHAIIFAMDPAAQTGYVSVTQGGVVLFKFNIPAATGDVDGPFILKTTGSNILDPTAYTITQTVGGEGLFVTYLVV